MSKLFYDQHYDRVYKERLKDTINQLSELVFSSENRDNLCKEDFEEWYKAHVSYVEYKIKKIIESYS
jgi:predicted alpha-1,6-mannanase (GH76 family)